MSDLLQKLRVRRPFLAEKGRKAEEFSLSLPDGTAFRPNGLPRAGLHEGKPPVKGETFPLVPINYYPKEPVVGEIKKREGRTAGKKDAARRQNAIPRQKTGAAASAGAAGSGQKHKIRRGYQSPLRRENAPWPRGRKSRLWHGNPAPPPPRNGTACRPAPEFHHI